jgi:predicted Zn-ribbon and HTH transcriptional regulator
LAPDTAAEITRSALAAVRQLAATNERQREQVARLRQAAEAAELNELQRRLEEEERREAVDRAERLRKMRQHIVEEVVNLRCPRCRAVFADYDGCDALKCPMAGCGCGFCALCLADCGADAHQHVAAANHHGDGR